MSLQLARACGWSWCTLYKHPLCNFNFADAQTMCFGEGGIFDNIPALPSEYFNRKRCGSAAMRLPKLDCGAVVLRTASLLLISQVSGFHFKAGSDRNVKRVRLPLPTDAIKMLPRARKFPNFGGSKHEQTRNLLPFTMSICAVKIPLHRPFQAILRMFATEKRKSTKGEAKSFAAKMFEWMKQSCSVHRFPVLRCCFGFRYWE